LILNVMTLLLIVITERDRSAGVCRDEEPHPEPYSRGAWALLAEFVQSLLNPSLLVRGLGDVPELCGTGGAVARPMEAGGEDWREDNARIACRSRIAQHIQRH
jgi:hypothetical protein